MRRLELNDDQLWLVLRGLHFVTSEEGEQKLISEFPNSNLEEIGENVNSILDQLKM